MTDCDKAFLKEMQSCSNCAGKGFVLNIESTLRQGEIGSFWEENKTNRTCWACDGRGHNLNVVVR